MNIFILIKRKFVVLGFISLALPLLPQSQHTGNSPTFWSKLDYQVGITPSAFLNSYHGIQIRQGIRIYDRFRFHIESGWIFYYELTEGDPTSGMRLRPSIDYMIPSKIRGTGHRIGLFYNIRYSISNMERSEVRSGGQYIEYMRGTRKNHFYGPGVYYGYIQESGPLKIETGTGFGIGKFWNEYNPDFLTPEDNNIFGRNLFSITEPAHLPIIILHFSIVLSLNKKEN